jgi:23S rRNA (guanosine2251-2'-O)-methyltransferase
MTDPVARSYVAGLHSVKAALKSSVSEIECLYIQKGRRDTRLRDLQVLAAKHAIPVQEVNRSTLNDLVADVQHQGVVAQLHTASAGIRAGLLEFVEARLTQADQPGLLLLILDEVQDPHNLGACLRCADAAGVDAVVIPADHSVGLTPVVRKVASGAAETMPLFQVSNLQRALGELQKAGVWVYGAAAEAGTSLFQVDLTGHVAIVMGAEGSGLRRLTRERCDGLFHLPMKGTVSSLNVSVASGISLYEVVRQRDARAER